MSESIDVSKYNVPTELALAVIVNYNSKSQSQKQWHDEGITELKFLV